MAQSSRQKVDLKLDWCSYDAAKYAVENWHYSKQIPAGKRVHIGVWENEKFIGAIIYSWGANNNIGKPFGLKMTQVCELVRVALTKHKSEVSKIVSISMKMLKRQSPGIRLIVSYADPRQGHVGIIYQAMNWIFTGSSNPQAAVIHQGRMMHKRTADSLFGTIKGLTKSVVLWKHKYLFPLNEAMRKQIEPLRKPYPKRAASETIDTLGVHPGKGGEAPTAALHLSRKVK